MSLSRMDKSKLEFGQDQLTQLLCKNSMMVFGIVLDWFAKKKSQSKHLLMIAHKLRIHLWTRVTLTGALQYFLGNLQTLVTDLSLGS